MQTEFLYIILFLCSVFVASVSQILLKKSANKKYTTKIEEYLNQTVISAYALFFFSTLLTVFAYKQLPLSLGPILESTGYIWVSVLGVLILKERLSRKKILGMVTIVVGVLIFNI